jgi:hypothetical protein
MLAVRRGTRLLSYYRRFGSWRGEGVEALIGDFGGVGMVLKSSVLRSQSNGRDPFIL